MFMCKNTIVQVVGNNDVIIIIEQGKKKDLILTGS